MWPSMRGTCRRWPASGASVATRGTSSPRSLVARRGTSSGRSSDCGISPRRSGLVPAHDDSPPRASVGPSSRCSADPLLLSLSSAARIASTTRRSSRYRAPRLSRRRDDPDLAPLIWPAHYLRLPYSRIGHAWQYALARRADAVIAVSQATKQDVVERLRVPEDRVTVISEAVDSDFLPPPAAEGRALAQERFGVPDRYVLYVGQFDPRKNVRGLLRAFAVAGRPRKDLRLVIVGELGKPRSHLAMPSSPSGAPRPCHRDRFVEDATLAALYAARNACSTPHSSRIRATPARGRSPQAPPSSVCGRRRRRRSSATRGCSSRAETKTRSARRSVASWVTNRSAPVFAPARARVRAPFHGIERRTKRSRYIAAWPDNSRTI